MLQRDGHYFASLQPLSPQTSPAQEKQLGLTAQMEKQLSLASQTESLAALAAARDAQVRAYLNAHHVASEPLYNLEELLAGTGTILPMEFGRLFPSQKLEEVMSIVVARVRSNFDIWLNSRYSHEAYRAIDVFVVGGAPGTGKTRFGRNLGPEVLRSLLLLANVPEEHRATEQALRCALELCVARSLTITVNIAHTDKRPLFEKFCDAVIESRFSKGKSLLPRPTSVRAMLSLIFNVEQQREKFVGALAVIIQVDEVHLCNPDELSGFISSVRACFSPSSDRDVFPVLYLCGVDRIRILNTTSSKPLFQLTLPLFDTTDYEHILRVVLGFGKGWHARRALKRALNSVMGPPRLFLFLLMAFGIPSNQPLDTSTRMNLKFMRDALSNAQSKPAVCAQTLQRCVTWLSRAQVPVLEHLMSEDVQRTLLALVISQHPVSIHQVIGTDLLVNGAIAKGLVFPDSYVFFIFLMNFIYLLFSLNSRL